MTPHEYQLAIGILAVVGAALFLLGRYTWPSWAGHVTCLDDEYQLGRDDQQRHDAQIIGRLEMELDWWERGGGTHDALHPVYEVLSPAALDAVNDLPGPDRRETLYGLDPIAGTGADRVMPSGSRAMQPQASEDRAGEPHLLDWDAIRGHMTPLDVLKIEGWEIDRRWEERQAAVLAECRAAWDLAKVAA